MRFSYTPCPYDYSYKFGSLPGETPNIKRAVHAAKNQRQKRKQNRRKK